MKIAFFMRNCGYMRNFSSVVELLATRGHSIRVIFDTPKMTEHERAVLPLLEKLSQPRFNVEFDELLPAHWKGNVFGSITQIIRLIQDYLRYLEPEYANANKLRARAANRLPRMLLRIVTWMGQSGSSMRALIRRCLNYVDRLIPPPANLLKYLHRYKPDLLMVTPLVGLGQHQPDCLKAARYLCLPNCLAVASWDNLTNKGLVHIHPGRVLVWNEPQKKEAIELHGISPGRVTVTGAYCYDHWFAWTVSRTREAFLSKVGLSEAYPFILFLCSSNFIAPDEVPVVTRWSSFLRNSGDPLLEQVGILIRPHPQNATAWKTADLSALGNISVYPRQGANPVGAKARHDYYDSMWHSHVVVGANTTGMIEAGILGKPVHTVLLDEWADTQEGTLHFKHLTSVNGGLLSVAADLAEHARMLGEQLRRPDAPSERSAAFVSTFIRAPSLDKAPGETFVEAVESEGKLRSEQVPNRLVLAVRWILSAPLLIFLALEFVPKYFRLIARFGKHVFYAVATRLKRLLTKLMPVKFTGRA